MTYNYSIKLFLIPIFIPHQITWFSSYDKVDKSKYVLFSKLTWGYGPSKRSSKIAYDAPFPSYGTFSKNDVNSNFKNNSQSNKKNRQ